MRISRNKFDKLVERAIESLPEDFARWLEEVPIIVEDVPGRETDEEVLGLYEGHSIGEAMENSGRLPPRIMIYRRPLMDSCDTIEQLAEEIRKTIVHELGHHAGMDEEQLDKLGYGAPDGEIEWDLDDEEGRGGD